MPELDDLNDLTSLDSDLKMDTTPAELPNATAVLVLGICSIATCWLWGIPGLACGIIALVLHKKDKAMYQSNPAKYAQSYKNSQAGFICAIIGVSLSAIALFMGIISIFAEPRYGNSYRYYDF